MNRSLVAVLVFLFVSSAVSSISSASDSGIFRFHGGSVHPDTGSREEPGWLAGGAVGFGLSRGLFLLFGYDHIGLDHRQESGIGAMTAQLEVARPFHGVVTPRLNAGAGVYVRSRVESYSVYPYSSFPYRYTRTDAPFGMNLGGGLSFRLSRKVMLDLDARYHQTTGTESSKTLLSTFTAGLSFALSGKETRPDPDGYVMASGAPRP